ncbi:MAG TPA: hypothetical protein VKQ32_28260 [Polyangia bacterium]|nr:hypothetical protein [Polyangia bacterium]
MPPSSDLPPWLRRAGASPRGAKPRAAAMAAFAVVLFAAGAGSGFLFGRRGVAVAPPPPPAPVCPPVAVCPPPAPSGLAHTRAASSAKRAKPAPAKTLTPLPEQSPMDEGARKQALYAFAEKKGPELKECVAEPDRGPPLKLGVAFEIGSDGAVDFVQILGGDGSLKDVKRCYTNHLKRWHFPEELLRGEEKLLVNFVL